MPNYSIPPWIAPADTARQYLSGVQIGVNLSRQSQELGMQRERLAVETAVRQKEIESRMAEEQQRLMMQQAYHDQVVSLRQRQLEDEAAKNKVAMAAVASKALAQEQYRQRVAAGEDPQKVMLELGPSMGGGAGLSAAFRAKGTPAAGPVEAFDVNYHGKPIPGVFSVPTGTGGMTTRNMPGYRAPGETPADRREAASYLKALRTELVKDLPLRPSDKTKLPAWQQRNKIALDQIAEYDRRIRELLPALGGKGAKDEVRTVQRNPKTGRLELAPAAAAPAYGDLNPHSETESEEE